MKINVRKLLLSIIIPLALGSLVGFITSSGNNYNDLIQPSFAPPGIVFPIVWSILYILMGISFYIVFSSNNYDKMECTIIYVAQLVVNLLWSFFFFNFKLYFFSFLWILLLIYLVIHMVRKFYNISKISSYLNIPYVMWLIFASILNFSIYILNR